MVHRYRLASPHRPFDLARAIKTHCWICGSDELLCFATCTSCRMVSATVVVGLRCSAHRLTSAWIVGSRRGRQSSREPRRLVRVSSLHRLRRSSPAGHCRLGTSACHQVSDRLRDEKASHLSYSLSMLFRFGAHPLQDKRSYPPPQAVEG